MKWLASIFLAILNGCGNPYAPSFTTNQPTIQDLAGTWEIDLGESRVPFAWPQNASDAEFLFEKNGSFVASSLPGMAFNFDAQSDMVSGQGTWRIEQRGKWWVVNVQWLSRSDVREEWIEDINMQGDPSSLLLHYTVGDPDEGYAVIFRRKTGVDE